MVGIEIMHCLLTEHCMGNAVIKVDLAKKTDYWYMHKDDRFIEWHGSTLNNCILVLTMKRNIFLHVMEKKVTQSDFKATIFYSFPPKESLCVPSKEGQCCSFQPLCGGKFHCLYITSADISPEAITRLNSNNFIFMSPILRYVKISNLHPLH